MTSTYGETPERFKQAQAEFKVDFGDANKKIPRKNVSRILTKDDSKRAEKIWENCDAATTTTISGVFEVVALQKPFCVQVLLNDTFICKQSLLHKKANHGCGLCSVEDILSKMWIFDVYVIELASAIYIKALDMGLEFKDSKSMLLLSYACVSISIKFAYLDDYATKDIRANIPDIEFSPKQIAAMEGHVLEAIQWRVQCCTISGLLRCTGMLEWGIDACAQDSISDCIVRCYKCIPNVHPTFSALLRIPNGKRLLALACVEAGLKQMCKSGYDEIRRKASNGLGIPETVTITKGKNGLQKISLLRDTNLFKECVKMVSLPETSSSISPKTPPFSSSCEKYSLSPEVGVKRMPNPIDSPMHMSDCDSSSSLSPDVGMKKKLDETHIVSSPLPLTKKYRSPSF